MLSLMDCTQLVKRQPGISTPVTVPARVPHVRRLPTILPLACPRCDAQARAYFFTGRPRGAKDKGGRLHFHSQCNACGLRYGRVRCTWAQCACRVLWAMTRPFLCAGGVIGVYVWLMWAGSGL